MRLPGPVVCAGACLLLSALAACGEAAAGVAIGATPPATSTASPALPPSLPPPTTPATTAGPTGPSGATRPTGPPVAATPTTAPPAPATSAPALPPRPPSPIPAVDWPGPGQAALTFDDGPDSATERVAEILESRGIRGTFFQLGSYVEKLPAITKRLYDRGHSVQNHTWIHVSLNRVTAERATDELTKTSAAIAAVTGRPPTCFRPPYGRTDAKVEALASGLGLAQKLWNVETGDYAMPRSEVITQRALAPASGQGVVVLMHDGGKDRTRTVAALAGIIDGLRSRGYTFVTLCPG